MKREMKRKIRAWRRAHWKTRKEKLQQRLLEAELDAVQKHDKELYEKLFLGQPEKLAKEGLI